MPKELLNGQTEDYVEYSRTGQVIKGQEKAKARSKYDEDGELSNSGNVSRPSATTDLIFCPSTVYIGNHFSVWGSWYNASTGQWGFSCCHSTISNSYCTGQAGIQAAQASSARDLLAAAAAASSSEQPAESAASMAEAPSGDRDQATDRRQDQAYAKKKQLLGEGDLEFDKDKLAAALKEEKRKRKGGDDEGEEEWQRDKRRKYGGSSAQNTEVTEEELEAYRLARVTSTEDPVRPYSQSTSTFNILTTIIWFFRWPTIATETMFDPISCIPVLCNRRTYRLHPICTSNLHCMSQLNLRSQGLDSCSKSSNCRHCSLLETPECYGLDTAIVGMRYVISQGIVRLHERRGSVKWRLGKKRKQRTFKAMESSKPANGSKRDI